MCKSMRSSSFKDIDGKVYANNFLELFSKFASSDGMPIDDLLCHLRQIDVSIALEDKFAEHTIQVCIRTCRPDGPFLGRFPSKVQTDNGKEYENSTFKTWCKENNVDFAHGLPYSPHVQGQVLSFRAQTKCHLCCRWSDLIKLCKTHCQSILEQNGRVISRVQLLPTIQPFTRQLATLLPSLYTHRYAAILNKCQITTARLSRNT